MQGCPSDTCRATRSKDKHPPTLRVLSSVKLAPARHNAGPKKAVHCASFLTWTTGMPFEMRASPAVPAMEEATIAATGGSSESCAACVKFRLSVSAK